MDQSRTENIFPDNVEIDTKWQFIDLFVYFLFQYGFM